MTREDIKDFCDMKAQLEPENEDIFKEIVKMLEQEPCSNCIEFKRYAKEMGFEIEQEPRWIPMVRREPTDEEKAEYLAQNGEELCYMLENEMPLNGQEVLVSIGEFVSEDIFDEDFYNFENNDIENVDAWMPKPKPYREVDK